MITLTQAQAALTSSAPAISEDDVVSLLRNGCNFASLFMVTPVAIAAKFKGMDVRKTTTANVQLFGTLKDLQVYKRAVEKSAGVENFEVSDTWFSHNPECFSIVHHKTTGAAYLYAVFNNASSLYFIDGVESSKEQVANFMTPSNAKVLLSDDSSVHNVKNDVTHHVIVRTVKLENVFSIKSGGLLTK